MDEGFVLIEVVLGEDGRATDAIFVHQNTAATEAFGQDISGLTLCQIDTEDCAYWLDVCSYVASSGKSVRAPRQVGEPPHWYDFHVFRLGGPDSSRIGAVFHEVEHVGAAEAAMQRTAAQQAFLIRLSDTLRPLSDPAEIEAAALRLVGDQLGAQCLGYAEAESGSISVVRTYVSGADPSEEDCAHFDHSDRALMKELLAGRTVVRRDASKLAPSAAEEAAEDASPGDTGLTALVPLAKDGHLAAVVFAHYDGSRTWGSDQLMLLESAAEYTWSALGHARAEQALRRSVARFQLLSEANSLLLSTRHPEQVIQDIGEMVMAHLEADVFFNYVEHPSGQLVLNAYGGVAEEIAETMIWIDRGAGISGCVAHEGCEVLSEDVQNNGDEQADVVRSLGVQAYACHPLKNGDETIGTLSFGTRSRTTYDDDDLALMSTVTDQVSVAMQRSMYEKNRRKQQEQIEHELYTTRLLLEALGAMARSLNLKAVLSQLVEILVAATAHSRASVFLWHPEQRELELAAMMGGPTVPVGAMISVGEVSSAMRAVIRERKPSLVDFARLPESERGKAGEFGLATSMIVPLVLGRRLLGVVTVDELDPRKPIDEGEMQLIEGIASQAMMAIENARLYEGQRKETHLSEVLSAVALSMTAMDFDEALPLVLDGSCSFLGAVGAILSRREQGGWHTTAVQGPGLGRHRRVLC